MSGFQTVRGWQLVRDGSIGLALFATVAALAIADGAQAGSGLMTLPQAPASTFSQTVEIQSNVLKALPVSTAMPWSKLSGPWATTIFPSFEDNKPFQALIPLAFVFSIAFAFSAAFLRHVVGTYALAKTPIPVRRAHRSIRRFEP